MDEFDDLDDSGASPAPGSPLPPFRPSATFSRTRFAIGIASRRHPAGIEHVVDIDHDEERAALYADGVLVESRSMPARFDVPGGRIDVRSTGYGMRRIHLVGEDGTETRLAPVEGSPEQRRARLRERFPRLSRGLGIAAIVVLVVDLALLAPQALELVSGLEIWTGTLGLPSFASPIELPWQVNAVLAVLAALAALERALTFRHHPLLDIETVWLEGA